MEGDLGADHLVAVHAALDHHVGPNAVRLSARSGDRQGVQRPSLDRVSDDPTRHALADGGRGVERSLEVGLGVIPPRRRGDVERRAGRGHAGRR